MSVRVAPKADPVARCIATHDGTWMVVTRKGASGSSPIEIPIGAFVVIRDGQAERLNP